MPQEKPDGASIPTPPDYPPAPCTPRRGPAGPGSWRSGRHPSVLVFLFAFALYADSISNGFVFDDVQVILRDARIHDLRHVPAIWTRGYWEEGRLGGYFRPVTTTSYALDYALQGERPVGYHLVNVFLHSLIAALVVPLSRRTGVPPPGPLLAGLLFAAHPIHTEAAAWVTGRSDLLAALAFVAAALFWLRYRGTGRTRELAGLTAAYGLGVLSKEHVAVLPAVIIAMEAAATRFGDAIGRRRLRDALLACGAALFLDLALRHAATGQLLDRPGTPVPGLLYGEPFGVRVLASLKILDRATRLLVFPIRLSADYSFNQIPIPRALEPRVVTGALIVLGSLLLALRARSVPRRLAMAVWAAATWFPVSNLLVAVPLLFAERTLYLPSVGLAVILGDCLATGPLARGTPRWKMALVLVVLTLGLWSARTIQRNTDWRDDPALFGAAVRASPNSALMRSNYGNVLLLSGRTAEALPQLEAALWILPAGEIGLKASFHLSIAYERLGRLADSERAIRHAVALDPRNAEVLRQLTTVLARRRNADEARRAVERAETPGAASR